MHSRGMKTWRKLGKKCRANWISAVCALSASRFTLRTCVEKKLSTHLNWTAAVVTRFAWIHANICIAVKCIEREWILTLNQGNKSRVIRTKTSPGLHRCFDQFHGELKRWGICVWFGSDFATDFGFTFCCVVAWQSFFSFSHFSRRWNSIVQWTQLVPMLAWQPLEACSAIGWQHSLIIL